jgi:hypothetical protein
MAGAVEQVPPLTRVQIEEDAGNDNDLLAQARLEEVQAVIDRIRQPAQIQPQVERGVGDEALLDLEANLAQAADDEVALYLKVRLQRLHLVQHLGRVEHGDGGLLEGDVGAAIEVGAAGADGLDEFLGADYPGHTPARESEALGQAVDDEDVVVVHVDDVLGGGNNGAVAVGGVVVPGVELIHDQSGAVTADVLDLGQFWVRNHLASWVAWVGREDDGCTTSNLFSNLRGMNMVVVIPAEGYRYGAKVLEQTEHFVVGCVVGNEVA